MRVRVYKNLHTGTLSMQTYIKGKGWRVHSHPQAVTLRDVKFIVYESGRQRVIAQKRKNVHSYVEGELTSKNFCFYTRKAYYNPYKTKQWQGFDGKDLHTCNAASVSCREGVYYLPDEALIRSEPHSIVA